MDNRKMEKQEYDVNNVLTMETKAEDHVRCNLCGKGIWIPLNPDSPINHCFQCNNCGEHANIDPMVIVE